MEENFTKILCKKTDKTDKTDVLRHLAHGEGKSVIVERLIKTLKCKIKKWQLKIAKLILVIWINQ